MFYYDFVVRKFSELCIYLLIHCLLLSIIADYDMYDDVLYYT